MINCRRFYPFVLFLLLFIIVYSPVLFFNYLYHDDGYFWFREVRDNHFKHFLYDALIGTGRYTAAWLATFEGLFIHKVSDLTYLRFFGIVVLSANAYICFEHLRRLSFSFGQAFLVVAAMSFLPGFVDFVFYSVWSFFTLSVFFASLSFRLAQKNQKVLSILCLLAGMTIYPSAAMFYWVMVEINILFTKDRYSSSYLKETLRIVTIGLTGFFIYGLIILMMKSSFAHKIPSDIYNPYMVSTNWFSKIEWFLKEPLVNALNLWSIFPVRFVTVIMGAFIVISSLFILILRILDKKIYTNKNVLFSYIWQSLLLFFVFILTFLPNLLAQQNAAFYRCLIPLTAFIWIIIVWIILKFEMLLPFIDRKSTRLNSSH